MDEKSFEKKPTKKIALIVTAILIVAIAAVGLFMYFGKGKKPASIMTDAVENIFELTEKKEENFTSERITMELSAEINSNSAEIKAINPLVKALKLKSETETDMNKEIFNETLIASYDSEEIINAEVLIQRNKIYAFLNGIFSKYIEIVDLDQINEMLEGEIGISENLNKGLSESDKEKLLKDLKNIIIEEIEKADLQQEKDELDGEKVTKTTMKLTAEATAKLAIKIGNKVNEYLKDESLADEISNLEDELEYEEFDEKDYLEIALYTKGTKNTVVDTTIKIYEANEEIVAMEYNKESLILKDEETLLAFIFEEDENTSTITIKVDPEHAKLSAAKEVAKIIVTQENENEGTIKISLDAGKIMELEGEEGLDLVATLNIEYKIEHNIEVKERDTSNSVNIEEFTEEDYQEIYEGIQNNPILYSLFEAIM